MDSLDGDRSIRLMTSQLLPRLQEVAPSLSAPRPKHVLNTSFAPQELAEGLGDRERPSGYTNCSQYAITFFGSIPPHQFVKIM